MMMGLPHIRAGMTVGLLGGSFDPPHQGHRAISLAALRRFGLDHLVWLVSPGNPLKPRPPAPLRRRIAAAEALMDHPKVSISGIEAEWGTRYTAETLRKLRHRHPGVRFVWLMGADNLADFHRWKDWQQILDTVPVGVLARPGDRISARLSPAARLYAPYRLKGGQSRLLAQASAPAWCFVNVPMVNVSSTEIRARGEWGEA
ncbi:MAG: nicotinate-nucleotide adenylyltransferase [Phaeobacter italicus]|jgi:nicotinate-nucleotide adenylyltransferase|uniref:nicotinate-nucleotide adenylyltransferase n=1 Tax=Phaeobacter italicus TaxID=481446 RepID=UPI001ADB219B|nr:nicotinate-nucleotide adenylyltransferase [Phaeobacter italicus]MBO9441842.1 nicotinate-nucleotide adenylyltransferase [Phaeobacter italicus]